MLLALLVLALVAATLLAPVVAPALARWRERRSLEHGDAGEHIDLTLYDPGRERRAELRARELLRSCVNDAEWGMYRDLGFIRVVGRHTRRGGDREGRAAYAYLIYPHKPIVAYLPSTGRLLSEYCVEFPDLSDDGGPTRLPASDDMLAKWMALTSNEERVIRRANMHLAEWEPRRQLRRELSSVAQ